MALFNKSDSQQQHAYEIEAEIGKGAYGTVYKARDIKNQGKYVALKEIRILTRSEEGMPMSTIREIAMLQQLEKFEHPNIIRLLDVWTGRLTQQEMKLMLVFEHMAQDLAQYLEKAPSCGLNPDNIKDIMHQILNGVDFLHTNRIIHRDLKPQNILISSQGCVKIADFGLARIYSFHMALTTVVVTLYYRSPEVLLQDSYCSAVDIWSCGTILAELYLRKPLFQGTSEIDQLCKIFNLMGLPPAEEWPANCSLPRSSFKDVPKQSLRSHIPHIDAQAAELLEKMLIFDQRRRITIVQILQDPWFVEDGDISMSSLSSDSVSLNTSNSSADNMDHGYSPSNRPSVEVKQTATISSLPNVNGNGGLSEDTSVTEARLPAEQNGCFQSRQCPGMHTDVPASHDSSDASGLIGMPSQNGSAVIGRHPVVGDNNTTASDIVGHFASSGSCTSTTNTKTTVQDAHKPANGNHFRELYQPSSCSNSQLKPSGQLTDADGHLREPYKLSATSNVLSRAYKPVLRDGFGQPYGDSRRDHEKDKPSLVGVCQLPEPFKPLPTTASSYQQPALIPTTHFPLTTVSHLQEFQRHVTRSGQLEGGSEPTASSSLASNMKPLQTSAVLSSNVNIADVHCHPQVDFAKSATFGSMSVAVDESFSKTSLVNVPHTDGATTACRLLNGQSVEQETNVTDLNASNLQHISCMAESKQYREAFDDDEHYCPNVQSPDVDDSYAKKGIKRSRPY